MSKRIALLLIFILIAAVAAAQDRPVAAPGRILVMPEPGTPIAALTSALRDLGATAQRASDYKGARMTAAQALEGKRSVAYLVAALDAQRDVVEAAHTASQLAGVAAASPDYYRYVAFAPNDPLYEDEQQNLRQIGLERVWNVSFGAGVTVAVLDTGYRHEGINDTIVHLASGYDFWGQDEDTTDHTGHGTLVSHVIAEASNNALGCASAAPDVTIVPVKVFPDDPGGALDSDIIDGVNFAVDQGANVVNMSFGGGEDNPVFREALEAALAAGLFLVAATGNEGVDTLSFPSKYTAVFAVGSCPNHPFGSLPTWSTFSNYGPGLDLLAPGELILQEGYTPDGGPGYYYASGTSMSVPHVAAAAALMMAIGGAGDPEGVGEALRDSAVKNGSGWDEQLGWGELDVTGAIGLYSDPLPNSPPVAQAYVGTGEGTVPVIVQFSGGASSDPDGNILTYRWDFGDGDVRQGIRFEIEYVTPGSYEVELTVTDAEGQSDTDTAVFELSRKKTAAAEDEQSGCGCSVGGAGADVSWMLMAFLLPALYRRRPRS